MWESVRRGVLREVPGESGVERKGVGKCERVWEG